MEKSKICPECNEVVIFINNETTKLCPKCGCVLSINESKE